MGTPELELGIGLAHSLASMFILTPTSEFGVDCVYVHPACMGITIVFLTWVPLNLN